MRHNLTKEIIQEIFLGRNAVKLKLQSSGVLSLHTLASGDFESHSGILLGFSCCLYYFGCVVHLFL